MTFCILRHTLCLHYLPDEVKIPHENYIFAEKNQLKLEFGGETDADSLVDDVDSNTDDDVD